MKVSLVSPAVSIVTKHCLAFLLACVAMAAFACPGAQATQTAALALVANIAGTIPAGEEGAGSPQVTPPFKATDGNYYGIAPIGGTYGNGIVFKVTAAGAYSVLHNFHDDELSSPLVEEGDQPRVLVQGTDGNLYGICNDGGRNDDEMYHNGGGTIFKITLTGTYTKLYDFDKGDPDTTLGNPVAFVEGKDGNFYGLTEAGGTKQANSDGAFFKFVVGTKALTELYDFTNATTIGFTPEAQLLVGTDGSLYGTTTAGGGSDQVDEALGTIFKLTTAGVPTLLHVFQFDGENPDADVPQPDTTPLILGRDGYLYGATTAESGDNSGTVYHCTTTGASFKILHVFTGQADGGSPFGGLVEGTDGNFYGGLQLGFGETPQDEQLGGYFQITSAGVYTVLYKFKAGNEDNPFEAASALTQIVPGTFYGLTLGGTNELGTLSKLVVSPVVTSAPTATATVGTAFSYQITATNTPASFAATGLPMGLAVNATTGLISGKPTTAGTYKITLTVHNAGGQGTAVLTLTVKAAGATGAPVITSAKTASGKAGTAFSYQITATNSPTSFGVQGLPAGLSVNTTTGLISGTPQAGGTVSLTLNAYNAAGKGSETVTLTIAAGPPVITSPLTATATVGKAFSYQIKATGSPTAYGVQGLPAGLTVDSKTGLITGTPKAAGKVNLTLNVYNAQGKTSATLVLTIAAQ